MFEFDGFGKRLQGLRVGKNMTQGELADRLGVTGQAVSKWENDLSYPDITLIPTIATIFDVEVNYLFGLKKVNVEPHVVFPKMVDNLKLVHQFHDVACYSSKEVDVIDETGVKFTDGSTAELSNRLVINVGIGEIRLLSSEDVDKRMDFTSTFKSYEFDYVDSLDVDILSNQCEIMRSLDNHCRVHASGETRFIEMLNVTAEDGVLTIRFFNRNGVNLDNKQRNSIRIELPCEQGKSIQTRVNGSGELTSEVTYFEKGMLTINGSGSIQMHEFETCMATINGSGMITAKKAQAGTLTINGSGNIEWDYFLKLDASINGSGDIEISEVASLNGNINGSGDMLINHLQGDGNVNLRILGSGDIEIEEGNCKKMDVLIKGSGDVDASGVTVQNASIIIDSNGEVIIGRVIESSMEQIKKKGVIKILNRGEVRE